jgi:signal peptidase II
MRIQSANIKIFLFFLGVVVVDQLTKYIAEREIQVGETIEIVPGLFNLILTYNPGAAFGLMANLPDHLRPIALALTTVLALGAVFFFFFKEYRNDFIAKIFLAGILGGAVGNIIDRVRYGKVVDFLDFYIGSNHWPAFNIADSVICLGVIGLIFRKPSHKS